MVTITHAYFMRSARSASASPGPTRRCQLCQIPKGVRELDQICRAITHDRKIVPAGAKMVLQKMEFERSRDDGVSPESCDLDVHGVEHLIPIGVFFSS